MTKSVSNVNIATDTFEGLVNKTNILLDALANEIVTGNSAGGNNSGNVNFNAIVAGNTVAVKTGLRGGNVVASGNLSIISNTTFSNGIVTFSANAVFDNTAILSKNVIANGTQVNVTANVYIQSGNVFINPGKLTVNTTGNVQMNVSNLFIGGNSTVAASVTVNGTITATDINLTGGTLGAFTRAVTFDSTGSFIVPPGVTKMIVRSVGGGGAGAYPSGAVATQFVIGQGGGSGGYLEEIWEVEPGQVITFTIGRGANAVTMDASALYVTDFFTQYTNLGNIIGNTEINYWMTGTPTVVRRPTDNTYSIATGGRSAGYTYWDYGTELIPASAGTSAQANMIFNVLRASGGSTTAQTSVYATTLRAVDGEPGGPMYAVTTAATTTLAHLITLMASPFAGYGGGTPLGAPTKITTYSGLIINATSGILANTALGLTGVSGSGVGGSGAIVSKLAQANATGVGYVLTDGSGNVLKAGDGANGSVTFIY